jgi:dienelactone hydrolase
VNRLKARCEAARPAVRRRRGGPHAERHDGQVFRQAVLSRRVMEEVRAALDLAARNGNWQARAPRPGT